MLGCIAVITVLLIWSVNQTAAIKVEALTARARIAELEGEVTSLYEKLVIVKLELASAGAISQPDPHRTAPPVHETLAEIVTEEIDDNDPFSGTALPARVDAAQDGQLQAMRDPHQEPLGITEGVIALSRLDYGDAIESFAKVDAKDADYIRARLGIANAHFYSHQFREAVVEFSSILEKQADSVEAAIGLANAYQRLGLHSEQIAAYDRVISIEPDKWLHFNSRATAHLLNNDVDQAIEDFVEAGRLAMPTKKDQATALENVGLIYLREENWEKAFQHANEVNKLDHEHSWNWLIRGIAAANMKRNVDAYVSFDNWFKFKRATDPYLLKQILPETVHVFVDVSPTGLTKLVDPPLSSGEACENNYQCRSGACKPGPPSNRGNYCVVADKDCAAPASNGYLVGEILELDGLKVRCYQPESANARWTVDARAP